MDKELKNAGLKLQIVTTKRDHLAEIAHAIADGMEPDFFNLKHDPVTVTVHGSHTCAKKMLADETVDHLSTKADNVTKHNAGFFAPFYEMNLDDTKIQTQFIDVLYYIALCDNEWRNKEGKDRIHDASRKTAGSFVQVQNANFIFAQNTHKIGEDDPWLSLFVKKHHKANYNPATEQDFNPAALDFFKTYAKTHPERNNWLRLVELKVYKDTLLNSVKFTDAFNTLAKRPHTKAMTGPKHVHIWE